MSATSDMIDAMAVDLPDSELRGVAIRGFEVTEADTRLASIRMGSRGYTPPGRYTKLCRDGSLWMSDTRAERDDHIKAVRKAAFADNGRMLVTGLGLGMVIRSVILTTDIAHIDVVELDPRVIELVGPHYEKLAAEHGKTVNIVEGDAHERKDLFANTVRWDVAWHDIWLSLDTENLVSMAAIARRYAKHVQWQGFWGKELLQSERRRDAVQSRRYGGWGSW